LVLNDTFVRLDLRVETRKLCIIAWRRSYSKTQLHK